MFWVISFDFCIGRAPHSSHADLCVLRGLVVCVIWSVMLVRYGCFGGGISSLFILYVCIYIIEPFSKISVRSNHF